MKKYLDVLKKVNLFKGIDESDLLSLLACLSSKLEHYKKNEIVFMSGEAINSFGIVLSGEVQILSLYTLAFLVFFFFFLPCT